MKRVTAFTLGATHPSGRLRIAAYAEHFRPLGWELCLHHFDPGMGKTPGHTPWERLQRKWRMYRAAAVLRRLGSGEPVIISRELHVNMRPFLNAPNPLVLDIDDALHLGPGRKKIFALCRRAQAVVCGNATLAKDLSAVATNCVVIPTVVDAGRYKVKTDYTLRGPLRVGWIGSSMSLDATLGPMLEELRGAQCEMVVISDEPPGADWVRFVKWSPEVETAIADYMDIGIMPLEDTPFQAAKCGCKLIQYMAAGLPVVATPVGVNRELVQEGVTGYSARTPQEWREAIHRLAGNEAMRAAFGRAGRELAMEGYSIARWAPRWTELLERVTDESRRR
ncbi:MAG: glycosyltransferase family 4 protein [Verrucomicrobia bacterium]|nr:glycosyltransferase family 4 protein [Verrucomicrobiota bacterium]